MSTEVGCPAGGAHQVDVGDENSDEQKRQRYCDPYPLLCDLYNGASVWGLSISLDPVGEALPAFQHLRRSDTSQTVQIRPFRNRSAQTTGLVD